MQQLLNELFRLPSWQPILVSIIPVLFAITAHEVSHGWIAKRLGDPTAQRLGRLTLNPLKHIDPIGTVLLPAMLIFLTGGRFVFGWAKPVPVTFENLRHPKRDMVFVAAAGPISNFMMAIFWGFIASVSIAISSSFPSISDSMKFIKFMGAAGVFANALLMVFNLLPLPPLDGGRVAVGLLPGRWGWGLSRLEPYGFFILIGLMLTGVLGILIDPPFNAVIDLVGFLVGLS